MNDECSVKALYTDQYTDAACIAKDAKSLHAELGNSDQTRLNGQAGALGQLDSPTDWYSGGCGCDLRSSHIFCCDLVMKVLWPYSTCCCFKWSSCQYGHLALVNRLGSLHRNSVDRLIDWLNMTLFNSVDWSVKPQNKETKFVTNVPNESLLGTHHFVAF